MYICIYLLCILYVLLYKLNKDTRQQILKILPVPYYKTSCPWLMLLHLRQVSWLDIHCSNYIAKRLYTYLPGIPVAKLYINSISQWRVRTGLSPVSLFTSSSMPSQTCRCRHLKCIRFYTSIHFFKLLSIIYNF